jgi:hypothetical protein
MFSITYDSGFSQSSHLPAFCQQTERFCDML